MVNIELLTLEIRILLKCEEKMLSRTDISQLFKKFAKTERDTAIDNLLTYDFIVAVEKPKRGTSKTPIFYELTQRGKTWIAHYDSTYPS